jgi:hypothetical protein
VGQARQGQKWSIGLTAAQERAMRKLTAEWQSAYALGESITTLNILAKKGLCVHRCGLGSVFSPRTANEYRLRWQHGQEIKTSFC